MAKKTTKKKTKSTTTLDSSLRILVLHGKERFLIQDAVHKLQGNCEQEHGDVEIVHFQGATTPIADVLDEARAFGLMQQYKIIIVEEADDFVKETTGHRPILIRYCESPAEHATIVLRASSWRPSNLDKAIKKIGAAIKCEEVGIPEATGFCQDRAARLHQTTIDAKSADRLVRRLGTNLVRLDSELKRLSLMAADGQGITADLIDEHVPLSREEKAWLVQSALMDATPAEGLATVQELMDVSKQSPVLMLYCLSDLARKLYTASRLREDGRPTADIDRYIGWSPVKQVIKDASSRVPSRRFAALMQETINMPWRNRRGAGKDRRGVDQLAVRFMASRQGIGR